MRGCPNCGTMVNSNETKCRKCGMVINGEVISGVNAPIETQANTNVNNNMKKKKTYWWIPLVLFGIGFIMQISDLIIALLNTNSENPIVLPKIISFLMHAVAILSWFMVGPSIIIIIILYLKNKRNSVPPNNSYMAANNLNNDSNYNITPEERLRRAYIGENYEAIMTKKFSIPAFFLSWPYMLYRKLYIIPIAGMVIVNIFGILAKSSNTANIIYNIAIFLFLLILGFNFNKWYAKIVDYKINKIREKNINQNEETLINLCKKQGGTNIGVAIAIFIIFAVIANIINKSNIRIGQTENERLFVKQELVCKDYAQSIFNNYKSSNIKLAHIGCSIDNNKEIDSVLLDATSITTGQTFIAKYNVNAISKELELEQTTIELQLLEEKEAAGIITNGESLELANQKILASEFKVFSIFYEEEKYAATQNPNYVRRTIKINIDDLK